MSDMKLRVKAVLFDLDGTIVDSREAYLFAMKTALARLGKKDVVNAKLATEIPKRLEQNLLIDDVIQGVDAEKFLEQYLSTYYQTTAARAKPMPNASHTLKELSGRVKLALTTMRCVPQEKVMEELSRYDLAKYFRCIVTAFDTCDPKPSPEALLMCAKQLNTKISECAVVGDSVVDVRAGKSAGTKTVAVLSGIFSRRELEKENPDLILESIKNLPKYLEYA
jgi:phosphoglycolate phosphatase